MLTFVCTKVRPAHPSFAAQVYLSTSLMPERAEVGLAVVASWLVLAIRGWRCEASWVDRIGRFLGFSWITIVPFAYFDSKIWL